MSVESNNKYIKGCIFYALYFGLLNFLVKEGNGNPLQCFCLENPRDRGAWWAAKSWTGLKRLSSSNFSGSEIHLCCIWNNVIHNGVNVKRIIHTALLLQFALSLSLCLCVYLFFSHRHTHAYTHTNTHTHGRRNNCGGSRGQDYIFKFSRLYGNSGSVPDSQ